MSCLEEEVRLVLEEWRVLKARKSPRPVDGRPLGPGLRSALVLLEDKYEMTSGLRALERLARAAAELRDAASSGDAPRITRAYTDFTIALDGWQQT
jgi:hypothetical protein